MCGEGWKYVCKGCIQCLFINITYDFWSLLKLIIDAGVAKAKLDKSFEKSVFVASLDKISKYHHCNYFLIFQIWVLMVIRCLQKILDEHMIKKEKSFLSDSL